MSIPPVDFNHGLLDAHQSADAAQDPFPSRMLLGPRTSGTVR